MLLGYFLNNDKEVSISILSIFAELVSNTCSQALLRTIRDWPKSIYDIPAVIVAIQSELERIPMSSSLKTSSSDAILLMECLAEL